MNIAALVIGIVGTVLSFVPCFGIYAFWLGVLAVAFGGISLYKAINDPKKPGKGMCIAGLVLGIVTMAIASYQYFVLKAAVDEYNAISSEIDRIKL